MVTLQLGSEKIEVPKGSNLRQVLLELGVFFDSPCGGRGTCGKCKVRAEGVLSPPSNQERKLLGDSQKRLACQVTLLGDAEVRFDADEHSFQSPKIQPLSQLKSIGAAVDLGTTTIAAFLVDLDTKKVLSSAEILNPQVSYGADVLTRLAFAQEGGADKLTVSLRRGVRELLQKLTEKAGGEIWHLESLVLVGNSAIHHLWWGLDTTTLAQAPYRPFETQAITEDALALGLPLAPGAQVYFLPLVAGFVGADTVAALLATQLFERKGTRLLVDLGTNGELVLVNQDRILTASTAAGPALEGAEISCGMRGTRGAIEHVEIVDSELHYRVIGKTAPLGICGSGLLALLAALLKVGVVDRTGRLLNRAEFLAQGGEPKLASRITEDGFEVAQRATSPIILTGGDIRKLQLAKGAVRSGIEVLLAAEKLKSTELEEVILAGAFGNFLDPESALVTGLLPPLDLQKIKSVGNAAGEGAVKVLGSNQARLAAEKLAEKMEYLELATRSDFQERFMDAIMF